jgi:hypothetical protein
MNRVLWLDSIQPMRFHFICWSVIVALQFSCHADVTELAPEDLKALGEVARFHEIRGGTNLPPAVFALCADLKGKLAEPGQNWAVTDVKGDDTFPKKRLIWAVTDGEYYVVHYERGGYAHTFHILVAKFKEGESKPSLVWRSVGGPITDFKAYLQGLGGNKSDDRSDHAH